MLLKTIDISNEKRTKSIAEMLFDTSEVGDTFALSGDLGVGKTSFAKYFIQKGCKRVRVPSPSYNIYFQYKSFKSIIYHIDVWRLENADDFLNLGIIDFLKSSIFLIEWADKVENFIPKSSLKIIFNVVEEKRQISFVGDRLWKKRINKMFYENKPV